MNGSANLKNLIEPWRVLVFMAVVGLVFFIFFARLFSLQILQADEWVAKAAENSVEVFNLPALRGVIYDRNGTILARNIASYNIVVTAANLPSDEGATQEIFRQLSALIGMPVSRGEVSDENPYVPCISDHGIAQIAEYGINSKPYTPVKIKCDIDEKLAMAIQEKAMDWPGISVEIQPIRDYPTGSLTANLIGFLGPIPANQEEAFIAKGLIPNRDKVGYAGLEYQYQDLLAGKNGRRVSEIDVAGEVTRPDVEPPVAAEPGLNLRLTIDTRLQLAAETIVKKEIEEWNMVVLEHKKMTNGVVIAMNPQTGEILAMVSYPTFDNQRMSRLIPAYYYEQLVEDPTNPLLNHAVGDRVPVGSVFKIVTGTGALNEGVVTPEQIVKTPGKLDIIEKYYANDVGRPKPLVDWIYKDNPAGFGQLDFVHGLAYSSNVYFYKLGGGFEDEIPEGLGICRLGEYARALGYGPEPGIGLPDEQEGLIPDPKWKRINQAESWSSGDTYIASVGQGTVLGTPLQVLLSASVIANNGRFMQPTLIREILDGEGNVVNRWLAPDGAITDTVVTDGRQISPFLPDLKWDITTDPVIREYNETTIRGCEPIPGSYKTVQPWVIDKVREGMRLAVIDPRGTLREVFDGTTITAAGKTGTAEYCDKYVAAKNLCNPGSWPTHAWTVGFAPFDKPEIAVVAFVYNGGEGASVAGPIVRRVLEYYFELKTIDTAAQTP